MTFIDRGGVIIIGANVAGGRAAEALRLNGYDGPISLIGDEPSRPYERPPLSKEMLLTPENIPESFYIHQEGFYGENLVDTYFGQRVERLDLKGKRVELDDGTEISCERVILCTGTRVRKLNVEGSSLKGIHYLRTLEDSKRLSADLSPGKRIGLVGMGVIGAEVAASARKLGCEVVTVEPLKVPMARALGEHLGKWLANVHREEGVDVRLETGITGFDGLDGRVTAMLLTSGERVPVDAVVVGIGVIPNDEIAKNAGLLVDNGVIVDKNTLTSNPKVFAAGDVANSPLYYGGNGRVETYQNAQDQALAAARNIVEADTPYFKPQWFWTDQYDINLQVLGDVTSPAEIIIRGETDGRSFTVLHVRNKLIVGVITVNKPKDMASARRILEKNISISTDLLRDETNDLRQLLKISKQRG